MCLYFFFPSVIPNRSLSDVTNYPCFPKNYEIKESDYPVKVAANT